MSVQCGKTQMKESKKINVKETHVSGAHMKGIPTVCVCACACVYNTTSSSCGEYDFIIHLPRAYLAQ